jgi:hypothetical protein
VPQGSDGTTTTIDEPAPGKTKSVESPQLPTGGEAVVTIESSNDDIDQIAVLGEGDVEALVTEAWVYCWAEWSPKFPTKGWYVVKTCADLVKHFLKDLGYKFGKPRTPAAAASGRRIAASGCGSRRLAFRARRAGKNSRKIVSLRPGSRKLNANAVRYSCSISNGTMTIRVQTKAKGGLRKALGKTLDLQVKRANKAPRGSGKLRVTFGW